MMAEASGSPEKSMENPGYYHPLCSVRRKPNKWISSSTLDHGTSLCSKNGIKQRIRLGTNCPIPPNSNYTYKFQPKDQIGTFTYFPLTAFHKAGGGFGGLNVYHRSVIPIPYPNPDGDFTLLIGDWYKINHKTLRQTLDSGKSLAFPDGLLINGQFHSTFTVNQAFFGSTFIICET